MNFSSSHDSQNDIDCYRVYVSFCGKNYSSTPNVNMSNWISCYYPSTNSWNTHVTSIPGLLENHVLKDFAMVIIHEEIYVIGGRQCYKDVIGSYGNNNGQEIDIEILPSVLKYNVCSDSWIKCAPLGTPRFNFACMASKDGKIYVAGGQTTFDGAKGTSLAEVYDPVLDEWKQLPNMSTTRYKCVGVSWQEKFYVVGGFAKRENINTNQGPYTMERSSAEVYDPEDDTWHYVARMWDLDVPPKQIENVEGKLFSSGDCLNTWKGHIESYDGKHNIWPRAPQPHKNKVLEALILEEEEPLMDVAWIHMQIACELFLRFVASLETDPKLAKRYIDHSFVLTISV
ncbi:Serine/threonine protein phosphatase 2A 59 kDa regulatory subunit B' eta isoform [Capsicum chinense]|nr:Serine/threonine protein phosphatase 2A 59 kDa regulatory subunit B' eta isoform [Capsicum chinense]